MAGKIRRSVEITYASLRVLRRSPLLVVFPILSGMGVLFVGGGFVAAMFGLHLEPGRAANWLFGLPFYFVLWANIVFFRVALTHAATRTLRNEPVTLGEAVQFSISRLPAILLYAAIAGTVNFVLRALEDRFRLLGRIVVGLLGVAWTWATYLAIPVLAEEDVNGLEAVRRSMQLVKSTWAEGALGRLGLGLLMGLLMGFGFVAAVVSGVLLCAAGMTGLGILCFVVLGVGLLAGGLLHAALEAIYAAALYTFAASGRVAPEFNVPELQAAWAFSRTGP